LGAIPDGAHALAEIALILAMAVDSEEGPLTARAKLAQELRITLAQLREVVRDSLDGDGADGGDHSPVWDAEVT
jgi:hypothetical protein